MLSGRSVSVAENNPNIVFAVLEMTGIVSVDDEGRRQMTPEFTLVDACMGLKA